MRPASPLAQGAPLLAVKGYTLAMTSSALTILLVLTSPPAGAQDTAPADATPPPAGPYAALRPHRSCEAVLPPLATATATTPPPLCQRAPEGSRCVAPSRIRGEQKRPSQVLDPEDENPPPVPPYTLMYSPGIKHVFGWLKSLNTCRFQAGSAVERPEQPVKGEFQTDASFQQQLATFEAAMAARAAEVVAVQASTEPLLSEVTFVAALPVESLGEYSAEKGCFFPGPQARIQLDEYKSRDTIYRTDGDAVSKFRLVPRREAPALVIGEPPMPPSRTLKTAYFDDATPKTDLVFQSHPLCVPPEVGNTLRDQMERNAIRDFGIHFELAVQFRLDGDEPQWVIGGEFVNRTKPELVAASEEADGPVRADRTIPVDASAAPPDGDAPEEDPSSYEIPLDDSGPLGCQVGPAVAGAWWLGAVLLSSRRRRRRSSSSR